MKCIPNLITDDLGTTLTYYTQKLGFQCTMATSYDEKFLESPTAFENLQWAMLQRDGAIIFFQERKSLAAEAEAAANLPVAGGGTVYFGELGDTVDALHEEFVAAGVEILKAPYDTFYGAHQFIACDSEGRILYFGSV